jgi:outer membrane immunogenic protein
MRRQDGERHAGLAEAQCAGDGAVTKGPKLDHLLPDSHISSEFLSLRPFPIDLAQGGCNFPSTTARLGGFVMRAGLIGISAALGLLSSAALAADLPNTKAPPVYTPPPPPAAYNWTGFYVGVNGGYSFGESNGAHVSGYSDPGGAFGLGPALAAGAVPLTSYRSSGFLGGGQVGYNWQIAPTWVIGAETDFTGGHVSGSETVVAMPTGFVENVTTVTQKLDWLGTTRARLGYALNNLLFYGTGGVAYGQIENYLNLTLPAPPPTSLFGSDSYTRVGWAAGAGIEYGLGPWRLRAEYLHYDLGPHTITTTGIVNFASPTSLSVTQRDAGDLVRGGVSYGF